jgi:dTDP-glucose pyrophosphorylase
MYPFNRRVPKPLLPVCNKPIIEYQIEAMIGVGIRRVVVVIGHLGFEISRRLGDGSRFGIAIEYHEQEQILGIAHALGQLEPVIGCPFLLTLGDIFFEFRELDRAVRLLHEKNAGAVLAVRLEMDLVALSKNFTVLADDSGRVRRVIEKPRFPKTQLKGCGLYIFDLPIFDAIRRTPRTAMRDEYEITDSIQILLEDDFYVAASHCIDWDMNLTFPEDLLECNLRWMTRSNQKTVVAPDARIHSGAHLTNTVVGSQAEIAEPARISNTLVFPNSQVLGKGPLDRLIITPDGVVDCRPFEVTMRGAG